MKHMAPLTASLKAIPTLVDGQITDSAAELLGGGARVLGKEKN